MTQHLTDRAARAWITTMALFAETQPSGFHRDGPAGTAELVTGAPMPLLNGIISTAAEPDADEIAEFAGSPRLTSVAWSLQVRGGRVDDRIAATAAAHDLGQRTLLPFMLKDLESAVEPEAIAVREVSSVDSALYRTTMAAGYEGPAELFSVFAAPSVLDHLAMHGYVAEIDGTGVATSFGVLVDDMVGVFNIAVPPPFRRRGYGRAATAAVLRDAYALGARTAFLHASPLGVPLYEAMGFVHAENWSLFTR
ncbi:GNAT family N-acetyltransferase [Amycolatopsis sp. SID8362]|uniref:GNAT family N-acetyltransferase n=1 Tax=Amycolatopsis sp. SID8362 TaxID=2690346 RepID=UPI00136F0641|nr:GNAT family N-acetyltransferase [Amycolatopsis sp. SID8362]NBH07407.1 GNAT family N-acetyltransferase [Amycolatopsis sp. SID8362]NED44103.1 GNAT family N-acetyltransferase [Amycolatopsis sp. SID8362]